MTASRELGDIFKKTREVRGMTVEEAHRLSRIHPSVIRDIENGVFDRLGPVYTKSFIKKYAYFLKLDTEEILEKYSTIIGPVEIGKTQREGIDRPVIEKLVEEKTLFEKPSKETFGRIHFTREVKHGMALKFISLSMSVLFVFIFVVSMRFSLPGKKDSVPKYTKTSADVSTKKTAAIKKAPALSIPESPAKTTDILPAAPKPEKEEKSGTLVSFGRKQEKSPKDIPLTLTLKARGTVWVQVFEGDRTVYVGELTDGETRTLQSDNELTVWTGKGEYLEFVVGGVDMGKVVDGVKKDIRVSKKGISVNGKWVKKIE